MGMMVHPGCNMHLSVYLQEYASMVSYLTAMTVFYLTCTNSWAN